MGISEIGVMRHLWAAFMVAILLTTAMAGCFGSDKAAPADDPGAPTAVATDQTGGLQGNLVTGHLEPIANGKIGVLQAGQVVHEATSDERGRYAISDIAPGSYRIQAASICCNPQVREIDIFAGQVSEINFQLELLSDDDLRDPYVETQDWAGMISCAVAGVAICGVQGDLEESLEDPNDRFMTNIDVRKGLKSLVLAVEWRAVGGAFGKTLNLRVENDDCGGLGCSYTYGSVTGESPLHLRIDNGDITDEAWLWDAIEDNRTLQFRVFPGAATDAMYQQGFTVFYDAYYWAEAPDGASALPDS